MTDDQIVICSDCFKDFGLRAIAAHRGTMVPSVCPVCKSTTGSKLTKNELEELCGTYFVRGSTPTGKGIFAPQIQFNDQREEYHLFSTPTVNDDIEMLARVHKIRCFYYCPPLWQFGKPCEEDGTMSWNDSEFDYVIDNCQTRIIDQQTLVYRLQLNVSETELIDSRFCSPPDAIRKFQRFDSRDLPILYAAFDVETCLHESRITLEDACFVAVLKPLEITKLLDLSKCTSPAAANQFENPNIWLHALLYNGKDIYEVCRRLANRIHARGFDGFIYPSYFQQSAERTHHNIAFFGRPVKAGKLLLHSLQKVRLSNVAYDWQFAPVVKGAYLDEVSLPSRRLHLNKVRNLFALVRRLFS